LAVLPLDVLGRLGGRDRTLEAQLAEPDCDRLGVGVDRVPP